MPSQIGEYTCTRTLGKGVTSVVKLAQDQQGNKWAIKIFKKNDPNLNDALLKALKAEVETLQDKHHNNIVNMKEFHEDGEWHRSGNRVEKVMYIVLELIGGGELFDFIATGGPLSEPICRFYFRQMLSALHYLHSHGTTHRDLKPENILMDDQYNLRIADFGFAAPTQGREGSGFLNTKLGTESYMAPEIHTKQPYKGQDVDLFAASIILFIMMSGHPPFTQASQNDRFYKFISGNRADVFWRSHSRNKTGGFSAEFQEMLTCMFQLIPSQRLTMADVVGNQWMKGPIATLGEVQAEFRGRHEKILADQAQEEARKAQIRAQRHGGQAGAHRGVMLGAESEKKEEEQIVETKALGNYNAYAKKNTQFFTTYEPHLAFDDIHKAIMTTDGLFENKVNLDEHKYKMDFAIIQKIPEIKLGSDDEEEEKKEQNEDINVATQMQVKLLKVDQEKLAIEFNCTGGSKQFFYDQFRLLKKKLNDLNDA